MINIYKEEEAKTKLCPSLVSRGDCLGSDCMAWRWIETLNEKTLLQVCVAGYCGLGGKPE